jgi:hypothetical protein
MSFPLISIGNHPRLLRMRLASARSSLICQYYCDLGFGRPSLYRTRGATLEATRLQYYEFRSPTMGMLCSFTTGIALHRFTDYWPAAVTDM